MSARRNPGRTQTIRAAEEGSALIIALVFITAFSLIVAAVLSFADVGLRASKAFKKAARTSYAVDGAIAAATKRYSTTGPCDNYTAPPINSTRLIVQCDGPSPAAARAIQPVNSLLSLGDGGITSSAELRLLGDVFSTTTVSTSATMIVQGRVSALGTCSGPIQTPPLTPAMCAGANPSTADRSRGRDPDYRPAATVVPVRQTVPACPTDPAQWLVTLPPGYYDDPAGLTALTGGSCPGRVVWLQPGVSYFDLDFRGGAGLWTVNDPTVDIVGGTPKGWDPAATTRPTLKVPGSCQTNGDSGVNDGVQLIAGGGTRLEMTTGQMELCATPSTTDQQIALFGLRPDLALHTLEATEIVGEGFVSAIDAQVIAENPVLTATAEVTTALPTASLALGAFRPGVPSGSLIDTASVIVRHREDGNVSAVTVTADFPGSTCGSGNPVTVPASAGALAEFGIDLMVACGLKKDNPEAFAALAVNVVATVGPAGVPGTAKVDAVVVEVAYRTPVTHKPTAVTGGAGFVNPDRALEIGEQPVRLSADAALSAGSPSAAITVAGLGDPLPDQPNIDSAVLRVAHQDVGTMGSPTVTVPLAASVCTVTLPNRPAAITEDRFDLKACGLDTRDKLIGLTATFTATLNPGGSGATSRLDGIWLEVVSSGVVGVQPASVRRATTASATVFGTPERALVIGEPLNPLAEASLSGPVNEATLTVADFDGIPLPAGSVIDSAQLRVAHQEDANVGSASLVATVPPGPGSPGGTCSPPALAPAPTVVTTAVVDLSGCGLTSPEQLAALSATYQVTRKSVDTVAVPTTATATGFPQADTQAQGRAIEGSTVTASLRPGAETDEASVLFSGFDPGTVPAGSAIENATLRVAHRDDGDIGSVAVHVLGTTCTTAAQPLPVRPGVLFEESIPLAACGLTQVAQLSGLSVEYQVALAAGGASVAAQLDGVELSFTYRPPAVARLDGIELDVIFRAPSLRPLVVPTGWDVLKVTPPVDDIQTRFVAAGTIYTPNAGVDISMYGLKSQVLTRGVIARSIKLGLRAPGYKRPTGAIPPELVTFTAYPDRTLLPGAAESTQFGTPDAALAVNEEPTALIAQADLNTTNTTASLTLRGYDQPVSGDLPDSRRIDAAVLRVRHQDLGNTVTVTVRIGTDPDPCVTRVLAPNASLGEDQIDLAACGLDTMTRVRQARITYTVALDTGAEAMMARAILDGISLEVLSGPLVRASISFDRAKAKVEAYAVIR